MTSYVNGAIVYHKKASLAHLTHSQPSLAQLTDGLTEAPKGTMMLVGLCVETHLFLLALLSTQELTCRSDVISI